MRELSYQLYSSRNGGTLEETLSMLASCGYSQVEGFGGVYEEPTRLADALQRNGLAMPSGHFSLDQIEGDIATVLQLAEDVGMTTIYCPFLMPDERPTTADGWREFGRRLETAGKPIRDAGFEFGWHNHDFEFRPTKDSTLPIEALLEGGPSLSWEADLAWIVRGNANPLEWLERYGNRISSIHVKDIAPEGEKEDEDGWSDVGNGTMDWAELFKAIDQFTSAKFLVMEHDKPSDDSRFAKRSIDAVRAMGV